MHVMSGLLMLLTLHAPLTKCCLLESNHENKSSDNVVRYLIISTDHWYHGNSSSSSKTMLSLDFRWKLAMLDAIPTYALLYFLAHDAIQTHCVECCSNFTTFGQTKINLFRGRITPDRMAAQK